MPYEYIDEQSKRGAHYFARKYQYIAGHAIGIVHLEVHYPLLPGNVVNACTYPFPVRYKALPGGSQERIHHADPTIIDTIIETCRELEGEGVRAIAGACGYLGNFQREVREALEVPVFLSSLLQVPMIHRSLKSRQRIGILCADGPSFTQSLLQSCGVTTDIPIVVKGLENEPEFSKITYSKGDFDYDRIEEEVVQAALSLKEEHADLGAILLECSDMPPFAHAVQRVVHLPVFDFISMINWVHHAVAQMPYTGII